MDFWLLLEKSDETRVSKGISGYADRTGEQYNYDSLVPNSRNVKVNDRVILRKEDQIVGVGLIASLTERSDLKIHRRCTRCRSTDIRERKTKQPKWKCGKCAAEFESPVKTRSPVTAYTAEIADFEVLRNPPDVKAVKSCSANEAGVKAQQSILRLDPELIADLIQFPRFDYSRLAAQGIEATTKQFEKQLKNSLNDSAAARKRRLSSAQKKPPVVYALTKSYARNPDVVAEVLLRAEGQCEQCARPAPFIRKSDSTPYLEVHHKHRLALGGEDTVENAIALCPNCHRKSHYG